MWLETHLSAQVLEAILTCSSKNKTKTNQTKNALSIVAATGAPVLSLAMFCLIFAGADLMKYMENGRSYHNIQLFESFISLLHPLWNSTSFFICFFSGVGSFRNFYLPHPTTIALTQEIKESL